MTRSNWVTDKQASSDTPHPPIECVSHPQTRINDTPFKPTTQISSNIYGSREVIIALNVGGV